MKPVVISAFPGMGKTYACTHFKESFVMKDSDSSKFDKKFFPQNYIEHIKREINEGYSNVIFISSHDVVRQQLNQNEIHYFVVYPQKYMRTEFIRRYVNRGSTETFIKLLNNNFDDYIDSIEQDDSPFCHKVQIDYNGCYLTKEIIKSLMLLAEVSGFNSKKLAEYTQYSVGKNGKLIKNF